MTTEVLYDQYDEAVDYLTEHPAEIEDAWDDPWEHIAGCLFQIVKPYDEEHPDGKVCGCLTQVKGENAPAWTDELTLDILRDDRIPLGPSVIKVGDLPVFAEWMQRLSKMFGWDN